MNWENWEKYKQQREIDKQQEFRTPGKGRGDELPASASDSSDSVECMDKQISESSHWYVVQVMSGQEHAVAEFCKARIVQDTEEVFIPLYERSKKIKGTWQVCRYVLFPGYVFFASDDVEDLFNRLKEVPKLTKILRTGDEFTPLHRDEVEFLMRYGGRKHVVELSLGYIEGDNVVITDGPMKDWEGRLKKINRHKRIAIIDVPMFGRTTEITVGLEVIDKN